MRSRLWGLLLPLSLWTRSAHADFTPDQRQSDFSAFNMNQGELRLGLFQEEYAVFDFVAVGTYLAPWVLIPITKSPILNAYAKVELLDIGPRDHDRLGVSLRSNVLWADVSDFQVSDNSSNDFRAFVLPTILDASWVFDDTWTVTLEGTYVYASVNGDVQSSNDSNLLGAVAQRNFQLAAIGEMRLSKHVALNLVLRYAPWIQDLRVQSTLQVDAGTVTNVDAQVDSPVSGRAWLIQPSVTCSWGVFNLQAGVGYGNLFLPGIRTISSVQTVVPDLDLYFRF